LGRKKRETNFPIEISLRMGIGMYEDIEVHNT